MYLKVADADGCFLGVIMIRRCFTYYECDTRQKRQSTLQNERLKDKFKFLSVNASLFRKVLNYCLSFNSLDINVDCFVLCVKFIINKHI